MKFWEILKEENVGKKYKDNLKNKIWEIKKYKTFINLVDEFNTDITRTSDSWDLIILDFEEVVDWSKVPVDTKILVANFANIDDGVIKWDKRHFAKYENGEVYAWMDGRTSFTTKRNMSWEYAKLYKEGVDE